MDLDTKELIEMVLRAAGTAGVQGWSYLVHWTIVNAVLSFIGNAVLLVVFVYLTRRLLSWTPKDDCDADTKVLFRVIGLIVLLFCNVAAFSCAIDSIRDAIAPEGAAIHSVLAKR